jgi:hypothetical protein
MYSPSIFTHFHHFSSIFIQFHSISFNFIQFSSFSFIFTHFHPFASIFINFHPYFIPFSSLLPFYGMVIRMKTEWKKWMKRGLKWMKNHKYWTESMFMNPISHSVDAEYSFAPCHNYHNYQLTLMFHCLVGMVVPTPVCPSWKSRVLQESEASAYTET